MTSERTNEGKGVGEGKGVKYKEEREERRKGGRQREKKGRKIWITELISRGDDKA